MYLRHGFPSEQSLEQAQLAVTSRVMPLFRYDPTAEGVFGLRISLDGNPTANPEELRPMTPADWALGQRRFKSNFQPLAADAATPVALHEWLRLDAKSRARQTPYVAPYVDAGDGEEEHRYSMAPALIEMTELCLESWQTLQELAGVVTPFTERLEQEIRAEVAAEHQAELADHSKASEARIQEIQQKIELEIASKLRSRLTELASKKRS